MHPYYPIFLNIEGRRCVVVGGGQVALRKVKVLLEHGAEVQVASPSLCPELSQLAENGTIKALRRDYEPGDLQGAFIAVAATDDMGTNEKVAKEARRERVLVNVVDDPQRSDFIVPSYLRRGDVAVAISTGGRSPALARKIRTELEESFGAEYAALALLLDQVRSELKQRGIRVDGDAWHRALDLNLLLPLLRAGRDDEAKKAMLTNLKRARKNRT